jgi:hypothetical protein
VIDIEVSQSNGKIQRLLEEAGIKFEECKGIPESENYYMAILNTAVDPDCN